MDSWIAVLKEFVSISHFEPLVINRAIKNMQNNVMQTHVRDSGHLVKLQTIEKFFFSFFLRTAVALSSTYMVCLKCFFQSYYINKLENTSRYQRYRYLLAQHLILIQVFRCGLRTFSDNCSPFNRVFQTIQSCSTVLRTVSN